MSTLLLMKGLPSSGKTTFAKEWVSKKQNRMRISWNEILSMMGETHKLRKQTLAVDIALHAVRRGLQQGMDVVLDECNLYAPQWSLFYQEAQKLHCKVEWKSMLTNPEECKRRDAMKEHPVGDMMIDRLWEKYEIWLKKK